MLAIAVATLVVSALALVVLVLDWAERSRWLRSGITWSRLRLLAEMERLSRVRWRLAGAAFAVLLVATVLAGLPSSDLRPHAPAVAGYGVAPFGVTAYGGGTWGATMMSVAGRSQTNALEFRPGP